MKMKKIHDFLWEIPKEGNMKVPARIYASQEMLPSIRDDKAPEQAANVAHLPGIVKYSMAMPDIHWGYGFPIGGVAAFDVDEGVISPGGVGYDINCGVRLLRSRLYINDIRGKMPDLVNALYHAVPSGVGSKGHTRVTESGLKNVLLKGAKWAVEQGLGTADELEFIEEQGQMEGADIKQVSDRAMKRGTPQLGTLGSGNHFLEVGYVGEIFDDELGRALGLEEGQVTVIIHTGSRGFGYQVCDDYIRVMDKAARKYGIDLPDRQLCCAPIQSPEGQQYLGAMCCAINYAFANRQTITGWTRKAFERALGLSTRDVGLSLVYEVAHNIAKMEDHDVDGKRCTVCVHRKGATRAFAPGLREVPQSYRHVGQPVLIPGDMGRYSYVLVGTDGAMKETFGSTCHGAGRRMSRTKARRAAAGRSITRELEAKGILVQASSRRTVDEEIPEAYKDVADVVDSVAGAGISRKVAKLIPVGVVKG